MEMSDSKNTEETFHTEETFLARLCKGWRVTIYEPVRDRLDLKIGELVRVTIRKDES